jgi:hypothetical protein
MGFLLLKVIRMLEGVRLADNRPIVRITLGYHIEISCLEISSPDFFKIIERLHVVHRLYMSFIIRIGQYCTVQKHEK